MAIPHLSPISDDDYAYFGETLARLTGIRLGPLKRDLLQGRLVARLLELGLPSIENYRAHLSSLDPRAPEWQKLVNELTTNKTEFFRERDHFDLLSSELAPALAKRAEGRKLRVWSAACSSGEEPYSLAMTLSRALGSPASFEILATDIDTRVLEQARNGVYGVDRLTELPEEHRGQVVIGKGAQMNWFKVRDAIRRTVAFSRFNLAGAEYSSAGRLDLIFCRNVFIYFEQSLIERIANQFHDVAAPGAALFIGHSESLHGLKHPWKRIGPSVFIKDRQSSGG